MNDTRQFWSREPALPPKLEPHAQRAEALARAAKEEAAREHHRQKVALWRERNPEASSQITRDYYSRNKVAICARRRARYKRTKERETSRHRIWARNNAVHLSRYAKRRYRTMPEVREKKKADSRKRYYERKAA